LRGIRVLEMAAMGPVPFCGMLLADLGAEIVTIEAPTGKAARTPVPAAADPLMRGRSRITLDVKKPEARDAILALTSQADAFLEGFRPGVMERLGLGPAEMLKRNPKLVYGRMTGFGQSGPLAQAAGHDPNYLAVTGALHCIGFADRPPASPLNLVGDFGGGGTYLAIGVLSALLHARATGQGQVIDAAMLDGVASLMSAVYGMRNAGMWTDKRFDNMMDGAAPFGANYETADGKAVATCAVEPKFYSALVKGLGLDEAALPPRHKKENWPALREKFAAIFKTKTRDEWAVFFEGKEACVSPVLDMGEATAYPHNVARGLFVDRGGKSIPAAAPRFSATPSQTREHDAAPAEDTLKRWGVKDDILGALVAASGE
jgi:alpha-methylacyl-CoA racemase